MIVKQAYIHVAVVTAFALLLGACGSSAANSSAIATGVALTVAAQDTEQAQLTPTEAPVPPSLAPPSSPTAQTTKVPPTPPAVGTSKFCTAKPSFAGETIPDGTIMTPGQVFTKIWHITNNGTCSWDSSWKLVNTSGDLIGAAGLYKFPQPAAPGQTVDVPIVLTAPQSVGTYQGFWKIQSPYDGSLYGDSGSGNAFWVKIVVSSVAALTPANNRTRTPYAVTDLTYTYEPSPPYRRCTTANTFWTVYANISVSGGPIDVVFTWTQSDGNTARNNRLHFDSAGTQSVSRVWSQGIASSHNPRWMQVITNLPTYHEWPHSPTLLLCGDN